MNDDGSGRGDPKTPDSLTPGARAEWFSPVDPRIGMGGAAGLRFSCTMCGNCCTGPEGYVIVSDAECAALAKRFSLDLETFLRDYTHMMMHGRSLNERAIQMDGVTKHDCIFLDRDKIPGKAVCGVYEDRPTQCRTWPFWPSLLREKVTWERAKRTCPGIDTGTLVPVEQIRILRDSCKI